MTRIAMVAISSVAFAVAYGVSPLAAVAIAAIAATVLTAAIALSLRESERREIEHVMDIIDACAANERAAAEPITLAS